MDTDVVRILEESQALLKGNFLLSSGNHSSQYFQCARLLQYPDRAAAVIAAAAERLKAGGAVFDCVVGPAMGGIVVAYETGRQLGVPAFFTERNDEGVMTLRRGFEIRPGEKVVIAEDVVTTGKSTLETAEQIRKLGGAVTASVCIVDRRPEGAENPFGWPLYSALRMPAVLWTPEECPLCREGVSPAINHGSRKM